MSDWPKSVLKPLRSCEAALRMDFMWKGLRGWVEVDGASTCLALVASHVEKTTKP